MAWVTAIALATAAIGTGVSIYSQQQQAKSAERMAQYNNSLAEAEARNRELESQEAIRRQRIENRRRLAEMRNRFAGQGTVLTSGSPLAILGESAATMELSIADAARRTSIEAASLRSQGQMGLWDASQTRRAATLSSIATGLKGASSLGSAYSDAVYRGQVPDTFSLYRPRS